MILATSIALLLQLELQYFGRNYFYLGGGGGVCLPQDFFIAGIHCLMTTDHFIGSVDGELIPFA